MESNITDKITSRISTLQKEKDEILNRYPSLENERERSIEEISNMFIGMEIKFLNGLLEEYALLNNNSEKWISVEDELPKD